MPTKRKTKSIAKSTKQAASVKSAESYKHPEADSPMRPDVGVQPEFAHNKRLKKPAKGYRYDSSLSPSLEWDSQNSARDLGEWLIGLISEAAALEPPHVFPLPGSSRPPPKM